MIKTSHIILTMNRTKFVFIIVQLVLVISAIAQENNGTNIQKPKENYYFSEDYIFEDIFMIQPDIYKEQLKNNPHNLDLHYKLGFCYLNDLNKREEAIYHLEKAVNSLKENTGNLSIPP